MKPLLHSRRRAAGISLIELLMYTMLTSVIGLVSYSLLRSGTILGAKNTNINHSHNELRGVFDRVADHLLASNNVPTLISTTGANWTGGTPSPGVKFDKIVGEPYLLHPWQGASGSMANTATSVEVWRSIKATSTAPIPQVGDVFIAETATGSTRAVISAVSNPIATSGGRQRLRLTFTGGVGKSLSWGADQPQAAKIVRPEAFIVMPKGGRNELRYYRNFYPMPNLNDATKYTVLSDLIGTGTNEGTPFTILNLNGEKIVQSTLRVREQRDANWIDGEETRGYNTYFQLLVNLPSRFRPRLQSIDP